MRTAMQLRKLTRSSPIDVMEWPHLGGGARERSATCKRAQFRDMHSWCSCVEAKARVASAMAPDDATRQMQIKPLRRKVHCDGKPYKRSSPES